MDLSGVLCLEKEPWVRCALWVPPFTPSTSTQSFLPGTHRTSSTPKVAPGVWLWPGNQSSEGCMRLLCFPGISWGQDGSCCLSLGMDPCWNPRGGLQGKADFLFFKHCKEGWFKVGRCLILNSVAERNLFIFWVSLFLECFVVWTCSRVVLSTFLQIFLVASGKRWCCQN